MQSILQLIVGGVPLAGQAARIIAARVFWMSVVQAEVIRGTHLAHVLVAWAVKSSYTGAWRMLIFPFQSITFTSLDAKR